MTSAALATGERLAQQILATKSVAV
jgi:hypothetical protein